MDEGEEYIPLNEMVVYDVSQPDSIQCYDIPEMFGLSTTPPPSSHSHSITWIAAPIIVVVLIVAFTILILYCTFTNHLIPSDHSDSTNTNHDNTSVSIPSHSIHSIHTLVTYASDTSLKTERVNVK